jgi:hypothetical protein
MHLKEDGSRIIGNSIWSVGNGKLGIWTRPYPSQRSFFTFNLQLLLDQRKIKVTTQPDKLRWGYRLVGNFTLKEAYHLVAQHATLPEDVIWKKIWKGNLWPKVATFLWQVSHRKILTWDQLYKRGFQGSRLLSNVQREWGNLKHILTINSLWDHGEIIFFITTLYSKSHMVPWHSCYGRSGRKGTKGSLKMNLSHGKS